MARRQARGRPPRKPSQPPASRPMGDSPPVTQAAALARPPSRGVATVAESRSSGAAGRLGLVVRKPPAHRCSS